MTVFTALFIVWIKDEKDVCVIFFSLFFLLMVLWKRRFALIQVVKISFFSVRQEHKSSFQKWSQAILFRSVNSISISFAWFCIAETNKDKKKKKLSTMWARKQHQIQQCRCNSARTAQQHAPAGCKTSIKFQWDAGFPFTLSWNNKMRVGVCRGMCVYAEQEHVTDVLL